MNITRFIILLAAFILVAGCANTKPTPDPLAGWQKAYKEDPSQAIEKDCQDYIYSLSLSPTEGRYVAYIEFFKDGKGQHAEKITISLNHADWEHILIYDKSDKRIKTIKYLAGHSMS